MDESFPVLQAVTAEARTALQRDRVPVRENPFRVGRESRFAMVRGKLRSMERRENSLPPNNDIYLIDQGDLLNVSREHFLIRRTADGGYELVDRGSTCGTIVDGREIGGRSDRTSCPLESGSSILVGAEDSPYLFRFVIGG